MAELLRPVLDWSPGCSRAPLARGRRAQILPQSWKGRRPMNDLSTPGAYGELIEPTTLRIERLLPGPIERVWAYLTESDLRRQWLASGDMDMKVGTPFELVWRNNELTDPPGERPPGFGEEHRIQSEITELDPPRKLAFTFGNAGHITFTLEPKSSKVLLTLVHRRLPDRTTTLMV